MKIGQYLAKIWVSGSGLLFFGPPCMLSTKFRAVTNERTKRNDLMKNHWSRRAVGPTILRLKARMHTDIRMRNWDCLLRLFWSIAIGVSVCLSVHLSTCKPCTSQKPHVRTSLTILCMLPVAVTLCSSSGVAVRCVLPVLWVTCVFLSGREGGHTVWQPIGTHI